MKAIPTESYNKKLSPTSLSLAELIIHIANINLEMYGQTLRGNTSKYSGFSENIYRILFNIISNHMMK